VIWKVTATVYKSSAVAEMGDRARTVAKSGGAVSFPYEGS